MAGSGSADIRGLFLNGPSGPLFALLRTPAGDTKGTVLVVPPFAEEMNKSRRMVAEVTMGLGQLGWASITLDLYGTGDSGGDFVQASWEAWEGDIGATAAWCEQSGHCITAVLAVRLGCALAVSSWLAERLPPVQRTVLWQPAFDGNRFLTQFLRLRVAASLMEGGEKETVEQLRAQLQSGSAVEVAGYELSAQLAAGLQRLASPQTLTPQLGQVTWMEVVREAGSAPPAASSRLIEATRALGQHVVISTFGGEPFWASTEVVTIGDMISATVAAIADDSTKAVGLVA